MSRCPNCFTEIDPDIYCWLCTSGACSESRDDQASRYMGVSVERTPTVGVERPSGAKKWEPPSVSCPVCKLPTSTEACPACHYPWPDDYRYSETICLAMTGARTTGKSSYVAVVIRALEALLRETKVALVPATPATGMLFERVYERPLLGYRIIDPTRADAENLLRDQEPLIWAMGAESGRPRYLVLRDLPGEALEGGVGQAPFLTLIARADAVFFMFDPLKVPQIVAQLTNVIPAPGNLGGDPQRVLDVVLKLMAPEGNGRLAIVVSKFDTLEALREVEGTEWSLIMSNAGSAVLRCPPEEIGYDEDDGVLVNEEVRSLLLKLGAEPLVISLEHPPSGQLVPHRFFVVSALGHPPRGEALNRRGIAPHRCLDPLKWVLAQRGVIPIVGPAPAF